LRACAIPLRGLLKKPVVILWPAKRTLRNSPLTLTEQTLGVPGSRCIDFLPVMICRLPKRTV
jgi:hypothetical protein